jgi:1,4-dihydroxy-2-naphthoate octaprenyltransferase
MFAEIMSSPSFGEVMFLVAFVLFALEVVIMVIKPANWPSWVLLAAGLACMALGWLALPTGG